MGSIKVAGVAHALDITEQAKQAKKRRDLCYFSYCSTSAQFRLAGGEQQQCTLWPVRSQGELLVPAVVHEDTLGLALQAGQVAACFSETHAIHF